MRRKAVILTLFILVLLGTAAFILFSPMKTAFEGDRVKNSDPPSFSLRFSVLNGDETETLTLREGDTLRVSWQIDSGSVDLKISMAGEKPIYQANGRGKGDTTDFELTIPNTGDYTLSISGRNAKGWMKFEQVNHE